MLRKFRGISFRKRKKTVSHPFVGCEINPDFVDGIYPEKVHGIFFCRPFISLFPGKRNQLDPAFLFLEMRNQNLSGVAELCCNNAAVLGIFALGDQKCGAVRTE